VGRRRPACRRAGTRRLGLPDRPDRRQTRRSHLRPHGDPIPDHNLKIHERATQSLADLESGEHATIVRVSDSDPEMLRYLTSQDIAIGDPLELISRQPFDGPTEIRIKERTHNLGSTLAIRVQTT
jgi:Fe2+ transport system protein FeoA